MLTFFDRLDRRAALVTRMADRLGVDFAETASRAPEVVGDYRAAVLRCTDCTAAERCTALPETTQAVPGFCRNKRLLERLAAA